MRHHTAGQPGQEGAKIVLIPNRLSLLRTETRLLAKTW